MGRAPCCDKANVKKGPWSPEEDMKLKKHIETHGTGGNWITLPSKAGLKRCGKSCRLRWINYLRPDIKHGSFTPEEERIIYQLHAGIGSRWSVIALQLPGRTDNDIKNYWNTRLKKKLAETGSYPPHLQCMQRNFAMSSAPSQLPALTSYPPDGDMLHVMNAQQQHQYQSQMMYPVGQHQLAYNADVGPSQASPLDTHVSQAYVGAIRQHQYIQQHAQAQQQLIDQYHRAEQLGLQLHRAEEWDRPELVYQAQTSQEVLPAQEIMNFGDGGSKFKELYSSLASCLGPGGGPTLAENGMEAKFDKFIAVNGAAERSGVLAGNLQSTDMTNIPGCDNMGMSRLSGAALVPTQTRPPVELLQHHSPTSSCSASESFSACNNYHDDPTNLAAEDPQSMESPEVLPSTPITGMAQVPYGDPCGDLDELSSFLDWPPQGATVKEEPTELDDSNQLKPPSRQSSLPPRRELQWSVSSPRCGAMNPFASPLRSQTAATQGLDNDPFKSNNFIAI